MDRHPVWGYVAGLRDGGLRMIGRDELEWRAHDGGPCPVVGDCVVDYVWHDTNTGQAGVTKDTRADDDVAWSQVVRFRVVNCAPREFWINSVGGHHRIYRTEPDRPHGYTLVREVIE